jgi:hypothetical protein
MPGEYATLRPDFEIRNGRKCVSSVRATTLGAGLIGFVL